MKLTLKNIKEIKRNTDSPLTRRVCNYVISRWGDYDNKKYIFTDVLHHGCRSGIVGELIYYSDTVRFLQAAQRRNKQPFVRRDERDGTLLPFRTVRRQVGQGRPACAGHVQPKPFSVVRL